MKTLSRTLLATLLLTAASAGPVQAADEVPQYEGISSYSVTRLKIFEGSVWVRTPDSGEWEEFSNNSPVPERARISVPEGSEAELQFHGGQFMLLTGGTELDLRRLEDGITVFRLRSGEIRFDLPREDFSPVRVLVPDDARVDLPVPGKYWLIVPERGDSRVVVRAGEATVTTDRGESTVRRGEEARIGRDVRVGPFAGGPGEEQREETGLSDEERKAGVPPAAATELREYGQWVYSAQYGYVWQPRVAPGWTPYYYGRWVWISPYGWTWISSEPWGWYPYHYGYWYTDPLFGWVWYPYRSFVSVNFAYGSFVYPHYHGTVYYVPATVRFVGYGSTVRWVPLRPGERVQRVRYTRADPRLTRWERPLPARTVYVRKEGPKGREWTDWKAVRKGRGDAKTPRAEVRRETGNERNSSRQGRPERNPDRAREGSRERSNRPTPGAVTPERERTRERPEQPPARRMESTERPNRAEGGDQPAGRTESFRGESRGGEPVRNRNSSGDREWDRTGGGVSGGGGRTGRGGGAMDRGEGYGRSR